MRKVATFTVTFLALAIGGIFFWKNMISPVKGQTQNEDLLLSLNSKAKSATPSDPNTIDALVNEVFRLLRLDQTSLDLSQIKNRISRAERKYRNNERGGIAEVKVVQAINGLANRFNAPAYAKTNEYEVRHLRTAVMPYLPNFVGAYRSWEASHNGAVNEKINPNMSPAEAVLIMMLMIQQKQTHPYYQMTSAERQARWAELQSLNGLTELPNNEERQEEMANLLNEMANLNSTEILNLANRALDILGIEP